MDIQKILEQIDTIENNITKKRIKKMNLPLARKVIRRLDEFSKTCHACEGILTDLSILIGKISQGSDQDVDKELIALVNDSTTHLQEAHNLVPENHYTNIYMSYGVALGLVFGGGFSQLINQTALIGMGLPIGISIGLSIGSKKDQDMKEKGLQI